MITLHSSAPWLPVCLGSLVAFLLLTFSAVVAATLVQHAKLSERFVLGVSAWLGQRVTREDPRGRAGLGPGCFGWKKWGTSWENLGIFIDMFFGWNKGGLLGKTTGF